MDSIRCTRQRGEFPDIPDRPFHRTQDTQDSMMDISADVLFVVVSSP